MTTVVIADDQTLVRTSLATIVGAEPDIEVVGLAADGLEAVELVARHQPEVVLMDIRMPRLDGLEATRRIIASAGQSRPRVCVLTMFELDEYVFGALQAGASGFLLKDSDPGQITDAIRRLALGQEILSPTVLRRVIDASLGRSAANSDEDSSLASLTPRECEVLTLVGQGLTNTEIEQTLFISRGTLKSHMAHLLTKLGARDRVQLVIIAHRTGLV